MSTQNKRVALVCTGLAVSSVLVAAVHQAEDVSATNRATTGPGSCTLKNWNPDLDPDDAKDLLFKSLSRK